MVVNLLMGFTVSVLFVGILFGVIGSDYPFFSRCCLASPDYMVFWWSVSMLAAIWQLFMLLVLIGTIVVVSAGHCNVSCSNNATCRFP